MFFINKLIKKSFYLFMSCLIICNTSNLQASLDTPSEEDSDIETGIMISPTTPKRELLHIRGTDETRINMQSPFIVTNDFDEESQESRSYASRAKNACCNLTNYFSAAQYLSAIFAAAFTLSAAIAFANDQQFTGIVLAAISAFCDGLAAVFTNMTNTRHERQENKQKYKAQEAERRRQLQMREFLHKEKIADQQFEVQRAQYEHALASRRDRQRDKLDAILQAQQETVLQLTNEANRQKSKKNQLQDIIQLYKTWGQEARSILDRIDTEVSRDNPQDSILKIRELVEDYQSIDDRVGELISAFTAGVQDTSPEATIETISTSTIGQPLKSSSVRTIKKVLNSARSPREHTILSPGKTIPAPTTEIYLSMRREQALSPRSTATESSDSEEDDIFSPHKVKLDLSGITGVAGAIAKASFMESTTATSSNENANKQNSSKKPLKHPVRSTTESKDKHSHHVVIADDDSADTTSSKAKKKKTNKKKERVKEKEIKIAEESSSTKTVTILDAAQSNNIAAASNDNDQQISDTSSTETQTMSGSSDH